MTTIEWTNKTWNPTTGCDRISPGCGIGPGADCYALTMARRLKAMGQAKYQNDGDPRTSGPGFRLTMHPDTLVTPFRWRAPQRVFVNSMSDLFHKDVTDDFIAQVFAVMALTPRHTYQVLTKRPQRMAELLAEPEFYDAIISFAMDYESYDAEVHIPYPLPNVWLGTSVESDTYSFRADHLRATPAAIRFISAEPLLGPLTHLELTGVDWLIVGGQSGQGALPMHPDWVRDLRDRCLGRKTMQDVMRADVPALSGQQLASDPVSFFFKQWGSWRPMRADEVPAGKGNPVLVSNGKIDEHTGKPRSPMSGCTHLEHQIRSMLDVGGEPEYRWRVPMVRVPKKAEERELDGVTWDEFPEQGADTAVSS